MEKLLLATLLSIGTAQAASFVADVNYMGATMLQATVTVQHVIGGAGGWQCLLSVYATPTSAVSTQDFVIPSMLPAVSDADTPMTMCLTAAKLMPIFTNIH